MMAHEPIPYELTADGADPDPRCGAHHRDCPSAVPRPDVVVECLKGIRDGAGAVYRMIDALTDAITAVTR